MAHCSLRVRKAQEPRYDSLKKSKYCLYVKNHDKIKTFQNLILILGVPGRVFQVPGTEKSDFEEIGVASPELVQHRAKSGRDEREVGRVAPYVTSDASMT